VITRIDATSPAGVEYVARTAINDALDNGPGQTLPKASRVTIVKDREAPAVTAGTFATSKVAEEAIADVGEGAKGTRRGEKGTWPSMKKRFAGGIICFTVERLLHMSLMLAPARPSR
jgi:hypothetical protein